MSYTENNPQTYAESFKRNFSVLMSNIHTSTVGVIENYEGGRICSVKPQVQKRLGDGTYLELPVIEEVPLMFMGGSEFSFTYPLKKGDPVLIIFTERSIEEWIASGGEVTPEDVRRFALTDAIAIAGLPNGGIELIEANNEDVNIQYKDSYIKIKKDGTVEMLGDADNMVRYSKLETAFNQLKQDFDTLVSTFNAHIHTPVIVGVSGGSGAPAVGVPGPTPTTATTVSPSTADITGAKIEEIKTI